MLLYSVVVLTVLIFLQRKEFVIKTLLLTEWLHNTSIGQKKACHNWKYCIVTLNNYSSPRKHRYLVRLYLHTHLG